MDIFHQLGVNQTVLYQFILFVLSIWLLQLFVFNDFSRAAIERDERTQGNEQRATEIAEKTQALYKQYEAEARSLSSEIKAIFDKARLQSTKEIDEQIQLAKNQASVEIEKVRGEIQKQIQTARSELKQQAPSVSSLIATKLLASRMQQ